MRTFAAAFDEAMINCKSSNCTFHGQSCTASSLGIPQDGNIARVLGCSGAMQIAAHPARARDL